MKPVFTFLFLLAVWCARAQTAPESATIPFADTEPTLAELSARVEALTTKTSTWDKILARLPRISGYMQLGYEWSDDNTSTFFIKRARLSLAGDLLKDKLDYRMQIEFASPKIVDLYLRYRPFNALNVQVGEFKLPFSIENTEYPPLKYELIEYPLSLCKLMGFSDLCGLSATGRDLGAQLYGGFWKRDGYSILNYNVGVFNGEGLNVKDRNSSKDFVAKLTLSPLSGLQIAGSYYWGEYGAQYLRRVRYGAGACYDRGAVVLRGEWIGGRTGELESGGWYATAGWRATRSLMPVVRYDTFREDVALSESRQTNYTAGLTWQPIKYLRCQLNYTYEDFASPDVANRNVVAFMLSGIF